MIEDQLLIFRIILALTAWIAILIDNYKHRDLKYVGYAYTFLVLGTLAGFFSYWYSYRSLILSYYSQYLLHLFAVFFTGLLFALTAYTSHLQMNKVKEATTKAFRK